MMNREKYINEKGPDDTERLIMTDSIRSKIRGTILGICIGDALAMPVHW